jgi:hypothetical protein
MGRLGVIVIAGLILVGCGALSGNEASYRFRMTVEVDTPQGVRTGSSVYKVRANRTKELITGGTGRNWTVKGEAFVVDLPSGKSLFVLLKTTSPMRTDLAQLSMAALDPTFKNDIVESAQRIASGKNIRSPTVLQPTAVYDYYKSGKLIYETVPNYPLLVTFRDNRDPRTIERVDPMDAAKLGPGIKIKRITLAVTDDDVTTGIEKRLDWLPTVYDQLRGSNFKPDGIPVGDFKGLFSTEIAE